MGLRSIEASFKEGRKQQALEVPFDTQDRRTLQRTMDLPKKNSPWGANRHGPGYLESKHHLLGLQGYRVTMIDDAAINTPDQAGEGPVQQEQRAKSLCRSLLDRLRHASFWRFRCECLDALGFAGRNLKKYRQGKTVELDLEILQAIAAEATDWNEQVRCSALRSLATVADRLVRAWALKGIATGREVGEESKSLPSSSAA
jgi:hypothetical protein